jgi:hypothetical protein
MMQILSQHEKGQEQREHRIDDSEKDAKARLGVEVLVTFPESLPEVSHPDLANADFAGCDSDVLEECFGMRSHGDRP